MKLDNDTDHPIAPPATTQRRGADSVGTKPNFSGFTHPRLYLGRNGVLPPEGLIAHGQLGGRLGGVWHGVPYYSRLEFSGLGIFPTRVVNTTCKFIS